MFRFFSKIRYKLTAENRISKYLWYAIGEILLVVIGILIALSINNWNEERKKSITELNLLYELQTNLYLDLETIEYNMEIHNRAIQSAQIIDEYIDSKKEYNDSLDNHFSRVILVSLFFPAKSGYMKLIQYGTDLIKNDTLRYRIIELYEIDYSWLKQWIDSEREKQNLDIREFYRIHFKELKYFDKSHPVNPNELLRNNEYQNYINQQIEMNTYSLQLYRSSENAIREVIELIENELNQRLHITKE